jgi:beta-lactamase class A
VLKAAEIKPDLLGTRIQYVKSNFNGVDEESGFQKVDKEYYTVDEYLKHMIVYSDNAATLLLAKFIGIDNIMRTEQELNLNHTSDADSHTNFVSVLRYAAVFRILYNASFLNKPMSEKALQLLTQVNYKDGIRAAIPAQYNIAHKYGERDIFDEKGKRNTLQLHHFGIVYYTGKPYILGVMTRGGTREHKEKIIKELSEIAFKAVDAQMKKSEKVVFSE